MSWNSTEPRDPEVDAPRAAGRERTVNSPAAERAQPRHIPFELLVASVKDYAIFMLDPGGHVVSWNEGARRIKGYEADEIIGQHFSVFYQPEDVAADKPARELAIAASEGRYEEEGFRVRKDGSLFWANIVLTAVRDHAGELLGFAKVTRDLTERRRSEEERLRLVQAREALRLRDEFLSIASHELRTPLTVIELGMNRLSEIEGLPDRAVHAVERTRRSTAWLGRIVDALLDASRLTTGELRLTIECFDLNTALREVVHRLSDQAAKAGCPLVVRTGEPIEGCWDRLRVEQAILNLLKNAITYGASRPVEIEAGLDGGQARVRVIDHGPGIQEEDRERVFGRFERAASMAHFGGLGLGLYMARQIADAHGGRIGVESELGQGATFTLHLPLSPAVAEDGEAGSRGRP